MLWWKYQQLRLGKATSRLAVVERLAVSGEPSAAGPLIFALNDKDTAVRCAAAKALLRFHDRRAVDPLLRMLRDPVPVARTTAAETLGHLGDPVAMNHLVALLRDPDPIMRTVAARSLDRLGWQPRSESHRVMQILATGNLHQLASLGPQGVGPLLELLANGTPNKQFAAVKALGDVQDPRVGPAMTEALRRPNPAVRIAALGVLQRLGEVAAYPEIEKLVRDQNAGVRSAAAEAAARCGGARAVPVLLKCLKDSSWEVRQAAVHALGVLGDRTAGEALYGLISDPDRDVRESVVVALGQLGDRRAIPALVLALLDAENTVRANATAALIKLDRNWNQDESIRQVVPRIVEATRHSDYWVRQSASRLLELLKMDGDRVAPESPAVVLEQTARAAQPHPALSALADLLFDRDRDLRVAAAIALGRLQDKHSRSILTAALRDADRGVREVAQAALTALK